MASTLLVGPCALLLADSLGHSNLRIEWRWHIVLILVAWLFLVPLATAIHWGTEFAKNGAPTSKMYALFIHTTMLLAVGLFLLQTAWVILTSCAFLRQRTQQNRLLFSVLDDPGLNTLRLLVLAIVTNAFVSVAKVLYCALLDGVHMPITMAITGIQLVMTIFLAASYIAQVAGKSNKAEIIRAALHEGQADDGLKSSTQKSDKKSLESEPSAARRQAILDKIRTAMDVDQLYTQPGLSLRDLCDHLGESPHNISQAINESNLINFYDMVNSRRVALAAKLLGQDQHTGILDIAFECGFNSKSSFNSVFKRYTGATPSQYRVDAQQIKPQMDV